MKHLTLQMCEVCFRRTTISPILRTQKPLRRRPTFHIENRPPYHCCIANPIALLSVLLRTSSELWVVAYLVGWPIIFSKAERNLNASRFDHIGDDEVTTAKIIPSPAFPFQDLAAFLGVSNVFCLARKPLKSLKSSIVDYFILSPLPELSLGFPRPFWVTVEQPQSRDKQIEQSIRLQ